MASSRRFNPIFSMAGLFSLVFIFMSSLTLVDAWDSSDLELFDLVEEVQQNFYEVLEIKQDASPAEIRRAYRRLSLQLHPDKNKEENAEEKFRQLVAISEVLKDEEMRQKYDGILEHGLPDWRQPVYYYRRVRKMGLLELSILLSIILSVGLYLVLWSMYFERKLELEALIKPKKEKKSKKANKQQNISSGPSNDPGSQSIEEDPYFVQKPVLSDALPCRLACFTVAVVKGLPELYREMVENWKARRKGEVDDVEDDEGDEEREEREARRKEQGPREKQRLDPIMYDYDRSTSAAVTMATVQGAGVEEDGMGGIDSGKSQRQSTWTVTEESMLVKAMAKFPGGTPARWTKIAAELRKPVDVVTKKAKQLKSQKFATNVDASAQGITGAVQSSVISKKTGSGLTDDITYSSSQDGADELTRRYKSVKPVKTLDRTLLISRQGDGDSKEDCGSTDNISSCKAEPSSTIDELVHSGVESCAWTQRQHKFLEKAMQVHPRGMDDRWDRIAEDVPGKSKEECIARYKELVEIVKRRKQTTAQR